jgi:hypothetical protein
MENEYTIMAEQLGTVAMWQRISRFAERIQRIISVTASQFFFYLANDYELLILNRYFVQAS